MYVLTPLFYGRIFQKLPLHQQVSFIPRPRPLQVDRICLQRIRTLRLLLRRYESENRMRIREFKDVSGNKREGLIFFIAYKNSPLHSIYHPEFPKKKFISRKFQQSLPNVSSGLEHFRMKHTFSRWSASGSFPCGVIHADIHNPMAQGASFIHKTLVLVCYSPKNVLPSRFDVTGFPIQVYFSLFSSPCQRVGIPGMKQ